MRVLLTNLSDESYYESRLRLNQSALKHGATEINSYSFEDIKQSEFYFENKKILDRARGAGFWLWKPYIILESLKKIDEGDIVIYADAGIEIIGRLDPLLNICANREDILLFANGNLMNDQWTKRDCFILTGSDNKKYWFGLQCDASFCLFKKTPIAIYFLEQWFEYCRDERILTDIPNTMGKKNLPGFLAHRHDQSVLSLMAITNSITLYRSSSQYGNHYKSLPYRIAGEFICENQLNQKQLKYYSQYPLENSPYLQLLNHHRYRKDASIANRQAALIKRIDSAIKKRIKRIARCFHRWYYIILTR